MVDDSNDGGDNLSKRLLYNLVQDVQDLKKVMFHITAEMKLRGELNPENEQNIGEAFEDMKKRVQEWNDHVAEL